MATMPFCPRSWRALLAGSRSSLLISSRMLSVCGSRYWRSRARASGLPLNLALNLPIPRRSAETSPVVLPPNLPTGVLTSPETLTSLWRTLQVFWRSP